MTHPPTRTAARTFVQSCMKGLFVSTTESEMLGDACVDGKMRAVLRRADADARAVAQLIDSIECVDHEQARIELADERLVEVLNHTEVDLRVDRQAIGVRKAAAQAAAHQAIECEGGSAAVVRSAERRGDALIVLQIHPVSVDISELVRIEIELRRIDLFALRAAVREIQIGGYVVLLVVCRELESVHAPVLIVERR